MGKGRMRFRPKKRKSLNVRIQLDILKPFMVSLPVERYLDAPAPNREVLQRRISRMDKLPNGWSSVADAENHVTTLYKLQCTQLHHAAEIKFSIVIGDDLTWTLHLGSTLLLPSQIPFVPASLVSLNQVTQLLGVLDDCKVCIGNDDDKFTPLTKKHYGRFYDQSGRNVLALNDVQTIRHKECMMLVWDGERCEKCRAYRRILNQMLTRQTQAPSTPHTHTNIRYLSEAEKEQKIKDLQHKKRACDKKIARLHKKLEELTAAGGVLVDDKMNSDLQKIMEEEDNNIKTNHAEGTFLQIFWDHQKQAAKTHRKGMRWHPLMIRWCLYLRHQSSKAYETLRDSGIALPSQRTLRDYTYSCKASTGFSSGVDQQLILASRVLVCEEWKKYVVLLADEMYIREDLVYDKHSGNIIGYTDLGEVNNHLLALERSIDSKKPEPAKSMLVFMVKGLFTSLKFPYVQFATTKLTGDSLFPLFWEVVKHVERIGLKVVGATFDGATNNRRMIKLHDTSAALTHKVKNIHSNDGVRDIFFSDPPHLIKTTRNCWASKCRFLWRKDKEISWQHLIDLYEGDAGKCSGLSLLPKLKFEHVNLTSFSKMRVDLAAQVLSDSVSKALSLVGGDSVSETAKFTEMMDKFFDALNVSNFDNGKKKRKQFQDPYRSEKDFRLSWLENDFLKYLTEWEESVEGRKGCDDNQKKRMLLSDQTLLGLRMTALSFLGLTKFLFGLQEIKEHKIIFLSNNLCQDPVELFFGCQRQRGCTSDNPNVKEFCNNTQALRIVDSFCRGPVRGNCRKRDHPIDKENMYPILKRQKKH